MEIQCNASKQELYTKLRSKLEYYRSEGKFQISDVEYNDNACSLRAKGTGFKAEVVCADNLVTISLDLNFILKPMKGTIEQTIRQVFAKALGQA